MNKTLEILWFLANIDLSVLSLGRQTVLLLGFHLARTIRLVLPNSEWAFVTCDFLAWAFDSRAHLSIFSFNARATEVAYSWWHSKRWYSFCWAKSLKVYVEQSPIQTFMWHTVEQNFCFYCLKPQRLEIYFMAIKLML